MSLSCPSPNCRTENPPASASCSRCGLPLQELALLAGHHTRLFNQGLGAARAGKLLQARDFFSAVVHWCPHDLEARNALALAALQAGDREAARAHWTTVAQQSPSNVLAARGLAYLDRPVPAAPAPQPAAGEMPPARVIQRSPKQRREMRRAKKKERRR